MTAARWMIMLRKLPTFDPTWNDEVKEKWWTCFRYLLMRQPDYRGTVVEPAQRLADELERADRKGMGG